MKAKLPSGKTARELLDQLWVLLDPYASADEVRALPAAEFRARTPFSIEEVPVDPDRAWLVYRLGLRG